MRLITIVLLFHLQLIYGHTHFDLQCNFTEAEMDYYGKRICNTVDLNIDELDEVMDSVDGSKTVLEDVVGLAIENQTIHYLPYFLDVYFPKLQIIHIIASKLKLITKHDLEPYTDLRELVLIDNELQYLDGDVFSFTTRIKYLNLQDNNLFVINGSIFKPIKLLAWTTIGLPCMFKECNSNDCIAETVFEFKLKCEYDSIYPGFQEYFKFLMKTTGECDGTENGIE